MTIDNSEEDIDEAKSPAIAYSDKKKPLGRTS